ncbi:MAG: deoxyhypusine synthase [Candidatus Eisenbacteria bacterium]|uniref:Deoxyhypusine synthase n=1 Tax=Eiseniibacteriota bacterium TaxID=2212470 RepID=A0A538T128_UNCEI|nr:MAG: deoxyhypusine synthase [Candidatus Eisenbacteria bacterium]
MGARKPEVRKGPKIAPDPVSSGMTVEQMVDSAFLAYNAARLREGCRLFAERMLEPDVTVGLTLSGALTPAGLGRSCLIPLLKNGFVDWMVSTGANLYHDTHFGIGLSMHQGRSNVDDVELRDRGIVRIFDIFFDYDVLLSTDAFFREVLRSPEFQKPMGTAEFHHRAGRYVLERERALGQKETSLLAQAHALDVPVYTSSPGDSSIGMNAAALALGGEPIQWDVFRDVNESAAIVHGAKKSGGKSAILILGGGSPKNFALQTEPQIQEVLGIAESGHDYFLQITDARADTGGLSGATPGEAVSWGKLDPNRLPDAVTAYVDSTIALPILTAYALGKRAARPLKRLYKRRDALLEAIRAAHLDATAGAAKESRS